MARFRAGRSRILENLLSLLCVLLIYIALGNDFFNFFVDSIVIQQVVHGLLVCCRDSDELDV